MSRLDHDCADASVLTAHLEAQPLAALLSQARELAWSVHGPRVSYSRKVFIPLTRLCRDICAYCTFATVPSKLPRAFLTPDEVLEIARAGQAAGCGEALFTLGDKPELRYAVARHELERLGHGTTVDYLVAMCKLVLSETSLVPHVNAGVMPSEDIARLRAVYEKIDQLQAALPNPVDPRLAHYLERKSYDKALEYLEGRDD